MLTTQRGQADGEPKIAADSAGQVQLANRRKSKKSKQGKEKKLKTGSEDDGSNENDEFNEKRGRTRGTGVRCTQHTGVPRGLPTVRETGRK